MQLLAMVDSNNNNNSSLACQALLVVALTLQQNSVAQKLFISGGHLSKLVAPLTFAPRDLLQVRVAYDDTWILQLPLPFDLRYVTACIRGSCKCTLSIKLQIHDQIEVRQDAHVGTRHVALPWLLMCAGR